MGIGRRSFIKLATTALAGCMIDPLQAVVASDSFYINKKLGIYFEKPAAWSFVNVKDFGKLKNDQLLAEDLREYQNEIWDDLGDPICMATKYYTDDPALKRIFSPTITLHVTPRTEFAEIEDTSMENLMKLSEEGVKTILKDFKVVKRYEPYIISNCRFYEHDAEYLFEHVDINAPLKVELKVLKAENKGLLYDFNCHQSKAQNQIADDEFNIFKRSVKLI